MVVNSLSKGHNGPILMLFKFYSQRVSTGPLSWKLFHFWINIKEHCRRCGRPLPKFLSMSNNPADSIQRVSAKLFLPVVIIVKFQLDSVWRKLFLVLLLCFSVLWRPDIQHNNTQHDDSQHKERTYLEHSALITFSINDTQHDSTLYQVPLYWVALCRMARFI